MKCPHCSTPISPFSPAIMGPSRPDGAGECKQCNNKFSITADRKEEFDSFAKLLAHIFQEISHDR